MHRSKSIALYFAILATSVLLSPGCEDDRPKNRPTLTAPPPTTTPDLGMVDPPDQSPEPLSTFCTPNTRRCLGANSPLYEQCSTDGRRFEPGACQPGQMCRDGQCATFSCVPGRPLCVGAKTTAVCASTGLDIGPPEACPGNSVCRSGSCVDLCEEAKNNQSYIGCEYLAHELFNLYHIEDQQNDSPYALVVANTLPLTSAKISLTHARDNTPAQLLRKKTLDPGQTYSFAEKTTVYSSILQGGARVQTLDGDATNIEIPPLSVAVLLVETKSGLPDALSLKSTQPVVAYQFSPYCCNFTATNDASLLLPTSTLQREYRILSYPTWNNTGITENDVHPYIYIIATENNTSVQINSPIGLEQGSRLLAPETSDIKTNWTFTLQRGETKIMSAAQAGDFSGALVTATAPISVFTGHPCTFVPFNQWACDHLEEQVLPATTLGKRYLLQSFKRRNDNSEIQPGEQIYWRIVAHTDATIDFSPKFSKIGIQPPSTPYTQDCAKLLDGDQLKLKAGEACEFGTRAPLAIESTGELIVGGVLSGHESTGVKGYGRQSGDPALFLAPPVEQFRKDYTFVTPPTFKKTYAAIVVPEDIQVALNNKQISTSRQLERIKVQLDGQIWRMYSVELQPGVHTLQAQDAFGLVVYAYDDYVSYAFPGGLDLRPKLKE